MRPLEELLTAVLDGTAATDLESDILDFKEDRGSRDDLVRHIVDAAVCFANERGGTIVVGVNDKATGPTAFTATELDPSILRQRINELTEPRLLTDVETIVFADARLLTVQVPEGLDVYATTKGQASRRLGTDCVPMSPNDIARLSYERKGIDWTSERAPSAELSAIAIAQARALLSSVSLESAQRLAKSSEQDILRALGVVDDGEVNNAGALLLDRTSHDQVVYQYRRTPGGEPVIVERLGLPLVLAFTRLMELINARQDSTPVNLPDGQQMQIQDFPSVAVREAVVNALVHRDHRTARPIQVEHSPAVFIIRSPGPLVAGITPDNILAHSSKPRYPALAHAARVLGLAEEIGQGVDRMYRAMVAAGKSTPRIEDHGDEVSVQLVGGAPNTHITRFVTTLPAEERDDTDTLLIIDRLLGRKTVTARNTAPVLQKSVDEAEAVLRRLSSTGVQLLEPTRATFRRAHPQYRLAPDALRELGPAVSYHRRPWDEIDEKVVAHLDDYDTINNRTLQRLFDVKVQRASAMISDLVERGLIVKTSQAERGPSVEYGRGPNFPGRRRDARRS